ncbi:hypothetical protein B0F90DRAFT_1676518 [Multifurca ochricompacta]|uniref:Uncharacterized protein n=1 Tax=Multifurca ochricompacta TaxID=376703 RepID=A0AAD4MCA7_9AGAM|nr:hypothetical protein B0F90DRAFT_1676518 [Multifurca ochricompacta]
MSHHGHGHNPSSPQGVPVYSQITALGSKLSRVFTGTSTSHSTLGALDPGKRDQRHRSPSQSRQFQSSGRGGAGNIRASPSSSGNVTFIECLDEFSVTGGKEPRSQSRPDKITSTGRGGAGNIRSPSRAVPDIRPSELSLILEAKTAEFERSLIRNRGASRTTLPRSSGRGGIGNIVRLKSRSLTALRHRLSRPRG